MGRKTKAKTSEWCSYLDDNLEPALKAVSKAAKHLSLIKKKVHPEFTINTPDFLNQIAMIASCVDSQKPYGTELFNAVARLSWNIAFEAVALRKNADGELEIYLRQRSKDDSAYPNEWHAPGSVFRPGETEQDVADRLAKEFGTPIIDFYLVGEHADWEEAPDKREERGSFVSRVYLVEFSEDHPPREDDRHEWFPVTALPKKTVWSHREKIIPLAAREYADPPFWR